MPPGERPWVQGTETFMKSFSELLLGSHSSLSPSTRKLKRQLLPYDMCFLKWCLCLGLWQKEREKQRRLIAPSGHHSSWDQKGNPVLDVSSLSYFRAFVMVAASTVKQPKSEVWVNEWEKLFFSVIQLWGIPFLNSKQSPGFLQALSLPTSDIHSKHWCCWSPAVVYRRQRAKKLTSREKRVCIRASFPSLLLVLTFRSSLMAVLLLYLVREKEWCRALHP